MTTLVQSIVTCERKMESKIAENIKNGCHVGNGFGKMREHLMIQIRHYIKPKLKSKLQTLKDKLRDSSYFKDFYLYSFDYTKKNAI